MSVVVNEVGYLSASYMTLSYLGTYAEGAQAASITFKPGAFVGAQIEGTVTNDGARGAELTNSNLAHNLCPEGNGYLNSPYMAQAYLGPRLCVSGGAQITVIKRQAYGAQIRPALYNTNNLRILCEFPSRGAGSNWTASSTEPSSTDSFSVLNLNTDFTEQKWRSAAGVKTGIILDCDAGVGETIFLDTLAFLNHNMTTSANVFLFGSDNAAHGPTGVTIQLTMQENDFIYIAPDLPTTGYRYWRIAIDDISNSNDHVSIGTVVFGEAVIFQNECFVDQVRKSRVNYVDSVFTEAFSNVRNDRGIKNKVRLTFKNIEYNGGNWNRLEEVFNTARTTLKCLWIPTPEFPYRFFTFAKLTQIPEETHNVKGEFHDFVDFVIETDESL